MQTTSNIIDKNWKGLIKPDKLEITSNDDKTIAESVGISGIRFYDLCAGNRSYTLDFAVLFLTNYWLATCLLAE